MDFEIGSSKTKLISELRDEFIQNIKDLTDLQKEWLITLFDEKYKPSFGRKMCERNEEGELIYCPFGVAAKIVLDKDPNNAAKFDVLGDPVEFDELYGSKTDLMIYRKFELNCPLGSFKDAMLIKGIKIFYLYQLTDTLHMNHRQVAWFISRNIKNIFSKKPIYSEIITIYVS